MKPIDHWGLWVNLERVQLQRIMAHAEGEEIGSGTGRVPKRYFDAIVAFPEEALPLWMEANADRAVARMAKRA